jgi:hypothetical protein
MRDGTAKAEAPVIVANGDPQRMKDTTTAFPPIDHQDRL